MDRVQLLTTFDSIHVINDGDGGTKGAGDLWWHFDTSYSSWSDGWHKSASSGDTFAVNPEGEGSYVAGALYLNSPPSVTVTLQGIEDDVWGAGDWSCGLFGQYSGEPDTWSNHCSEGAFAQAQVQLPTYFFEGNAVPFTASTPTTPGAHAVQRDRDRPGRLRLTILHRAAPDHSVVVRGGPRPTSSWAPTGRYEDMRRIAGPRVALVASVLLATAGLVGATGSRRRGDAPAAPAATVVTVPGAPLGDIVTDGHGHAYVTNPAQNRVEVLNLATATLEAPIAVGLEPRRPRREPRRAMLYVANRGDHFVSVVDLARAGGGPSVSTFPPSFIDFHPWSLAVASNGTALVGMAVPGRHHRLSQDLADRPRRPGRIRRPDGGRAWWRCGRAVTTPGCSCSVGRSTRGRLTLYNAASDSFGEPSGLRVAGRAMPGIDDTGSRVVMDPGTVVLDGQLALAGHNPGGRRDGHRRQRRRLNRLPRPERTRWRFSTWPPAGCTATIPLPGSLEPKQVAVSADGATLAVLVSSGIVVVPVSAAIPVPTCVPSSPAPMVVGVCGRLENVVVDGSGHAYASNPTLNQIEVVSLATGTLEAPIPVGSLPTGLDLSPDGRTLYVADSGAHEVSVVDTAQRRELRRIPVPTGPYLDQPMSVAVTDRGTALVMTSYYTHNVGFRYRVLQLDLAHETLTPRTDPGSDVNEGTVLRASTDRSRVLVLRRSYSSCCVGVSMYRSATDSFTPSTDLAGPVDFAATGDMGTRILAGPGSFVFSDDLVLRATIPAGGKGVAVDASGTTGYRVQESTIDVLDLRAGSLSVRSPSPSPSATPPVLPSSPPTAPSWWCSRATGSASPPPRRLSPAPACTPPTPPAPVVPVCGGRPADVAFGDGGRVYVSNPARNQVEVLAVGPGALEAPIPVGSQPEGLDFSPDRKTLFVANAGGSDISVVDLSLRREVRRISIPTDRRNDRPTSIAVAADGTALVVMRGAGFGYDGRLLKVNLATGAVTLLGYTHVPASVEASGDRSRIAFIDGSHGVALYNVATGVMGAEVIPSGYTATAGSIPWIPFAAAVDATGSRLLVNRGMALLDGDLKFIKRFSGRGRGRGPRFIWHHRLPGPDRWHRRARRGQGMGRRDDPGSRGRRAGGHQPRRNHAGRADRPRHPHRPCLRSIAEERLRGVGPADDGRTRRGGQLGRPRQRPPGRRRPASARPTSTPTTSPSPSRPPPSG